MTNPLLQQSELPYGLPDFGAVTVEHIGAALTRGMDEQRAEVEAIATGPWPPSFEDTIDALERSGQTLARAGRVFGSYASGQSTPQLRALEQELMPRLSAHGDAIALDGRLYARISDLVARAGELDLDLERARLLERYRLERVRAGAELGDEDQATLRAINERVATLGASFRRHLHEETEQLAVHVADEAQLDGLPAPMLAAAQRAAREDGRDGFLLPLVLPTRQPAGEHLHDRATRERLHRASVSRGRRGGEHDTRAIVAEIAALRARRAGLLGYATHGDYVIANQTARTTQAVAQMLGGLVEPAVAAARAEEAELTRMLHADGHDGPLQAWDWDYYDARRRRDTATTQQDDDERELDAVLTDGVLHAAHALFGLTLTPRDDVPVPHPDVRAWEVADEGGTLGLFLLDVFARPGKRGGAWMSSFAVQSQLLGTQPVVTNTLNVPKPPDGERVLLSPDEVRTLFHEFGHALHGLLSDVRYPRLSGTSVPADFLEFPSQLNEMWAPEQPRESAYSTVETLAAMLLDQEWHGLAPGESVEDVDAFERAALQRHGLDLACIPPRYGSSYFNHVFGGGYAAVYYSYIWAEVLAADCEQWLRDRGGLRRDSGQALRDEVLSRGFAVEPMDAYRALCGREPSVEPLLRKRHLTD